VHTYDISQGFFLYSSTIQPVYLAHAAGMRDYIGGSQVKKKNHPHQQKSTKDGIFKNATAVVVVVISFVRRNV